MSQQVPETKETQPSNEGHPDPVQSDQAPQSSATFDEPTVTYSARFVGFVSLIGLLIGIGVFTLNPIIIASTIVILVYVIASVLQSPTTIGQDVTVSRRLSATHPRPGDTVDVTVTITNNSETTFTDFRAVDTVPNELEIISGSPKTAGVLSPNASLTVEYTVVAKRGTYPFGPVTGRARTLTAAVWVEQPLHSTNNPEIQCAVRADDIPLEDRATHFIGRLLSDEGGDGNEFYSTREYQRGDSPNRINWRLLAKRGELSTITYRESQAAEITVVIDSRPCVYQSATSKSPIAPILATYAAYQITATLTRDGHFVGITTPGLEPRDSRKDSQSTYPYRRFEHRRSTDQQHRVFEFLDDIEGTHERLQHQRRTVPTQPTLPNDHAQSTQPLDAAVEIAFNPGFDNVTTHSFVEDLLHWGTASTQFIVISPFIDDAAYAVCSQLLALDNPVVVISPDITTPATHREEATPEIGDEIGQRVERVERAIRIESLRHNDATVIDWNTNKPLAISTIEQTHPGE